MAQIIFYILAAISTIATALPLIRHEDWWIRVFDFPRIQILVLAIVSLSGILFLEDFSVISITSLPAIFSLLLIVVIIFQIVRIFPYTSLSKKQVKDFSNNDS